MDMIEGRHGAEDLGIDYADMGHLAAPMLPRDDFSLAALDMNDAPTDTGPGFDFRSGYGLIRADKALQSIVGTNIVGQTFQDNNSNGTLDGADAGVNGVNVYLDSNNNGVKDTNAGSTINFRVDYLRPAIKTGLVITAKVRRAGKSVGVVDVDVFNEQKALLAVGRATYSTLPA